MSKRFGRNQKRKLREAVQKLKADVELKERAIEQQREEQSYKAYLFDRLVTAIEQIAPHSICLDPETIKSEQNSGYCSLAIHPPMELRTFDSTHAGFDEPLCFSEQRLVEFCVDIEEYRDQFKTLVHVYTKDNDCNMHYMISKEALYTVGLPAEEIMRQFSNKWRHDKIKERGYR